MLIDILLNNAIFQSLHGVPKVHYYLKFTSRHFALITYSLLYFYNNVKGLLL